MNRLTIAAAAFAAGMTTFAAHSSEHMDEANQRAAIAVKVDKTVTASVAANAGKAIANAKAGKSARGGHYADLIAAHAKANGVPVALARAVVRAESNFRPNARGRAGEVGLMQIKPSTARAMGYSGSAKALYDPDTNLKYGMKYLGLAQKLGDGSVCGTLLRYNAGHGAKRMNKVSAAYCSKVKRHIES
jgi:soluble lytic murein transglycosylase-like protein